jgi:integrase/recombinase XerD
MLLSYYMTVLFWYRKNLRSIERPGTIYCRVTVNGEVRNIATVVRIHKADWDPTRQQMRGRSDEAKVANQQLQQLADGLREAFNILEREGTLITPDRVIDRHQEPQRKQASLLETVARFLAMRQSLYENGHIALHTMEADNVRLGRLEEWLQDTKQRDLRPAEFTMQKAVQMREWLLSHKRSHNYSVRVLCSIKQVLIWAVSQEILEVNPLASLVLKRQHTKPLIFLSPADLVLLWFFDFHSDALRKAADVFLFQCFTGLAWADLYNFRASEHLVPQPNGSVLLRIARQKTTTPMVIPLFRPAFELLAKYGGQQMPVPSNQYLNRALKQVAYLTGIKQHITTHVGRKTAGMILLQDGVSMTIVSKILGHRSVAVTEKSYATVLADTVTNELSKVYGHEMMGVKQTQSPFLLEFTQRLLAA